MQVLSIRGGAPQGRRFLGGRHPGQQPQQGQGHPGSQKLVNAAKAQISRDLGSRVPRQPHEVTRISSERS